VDHVWPGRRAELRTTDPTAAEREATAAHNRQNREREGPAERESEGVVVVTTGGQQNPLRAKGPYFIGARS
jgi:hypothetical protein